MMMHFLLINQSDKYNFEMNNFDVADQMRLFYRVLCLDSESQVAVVLIFMGITGDYG